MNAFNLEPIPQEMKALENWVLWKYEFIRGRKTKIPYQVNGKKADTTDPTTWATLEEAEKAFTKRRALSPATAYSGFGFVFSEESGIMGLDFDHVKDPETGEWDKEALEEILSLGSYAELSPSGEGAHVICIAEIPGERRRKGNREMYESERYFTVTGAHIEGTPQQIRPAQRGVNRLYKKWFETENKESQGNGPKAPEKRNSKALSDSEIIELCRKARNAGPFESLYSGSWEGSYPSQSEADLALCSFLAFYTQDPGQIDRIFCSSGLYRKKWDRPDYKNKTISEAVNGVTETYNPEKKKSKQNKDEKEEGTDIKLPFDVVGERIMKKYKIFTMEDTKEFYVYRNGVYKNEGMKAFLEMEIREEFKALFLEQWEEMNPGKDPEHIPAAKTGFVNEVLAYIHAYRYKLRKDIDAMQGGYINFKNGFFNLDSWELEPHDPGKFSIRQIPVMYDPEAECPQINEFLNSVVEPEDKKVLIEWAGYSLIPDTRMQKAVMLQGEGSNGKSVFLNLLTAFIGEENKSGESLQKLENDRFSVANLYGKLLNVFPDLPDTSLYKNDTFNMLVGDDKQIRGERKYCDPFHFNNTARLIFSANKLPYAKSDNFAYYRRWIIIKFPHSFEGKREDKNLLGKLTTEKELSGFLNLVLKGLKYVLENNEFSYNVSTEEIERIYRLNSDPVAVFADTCTTASTEHTSKTDMYLGYVQWCQAMGEKKILKNNEFSKRFKKLGYSDFRENVPEGGKYTKISLWEFVKLDLDRLSPSSLSTFEKPDDDGFNDLDRLDRLETPMYIKKEKPSLQKCEKREKEEKNNTIGFEPVQPVQTQKNDIMQPLKCGQALNVEPVQKGDFRLLRIDLMNFAKTFYNLTVEDLDKFIDDFNHKYPGYLKNHTRRDIKDLAGLLKQRGWK